MHSRPVWIISSSRLSCRQTRVQELHTKEGEVDEGKVVEEQEPEEFACTTHAPESGR